MKHKSEDLYDHIVPECSIACSNCRKPESVMNYNEDEAQEHFFAEGWRATKSGNVYCPECANKKLKQNKK
jgi:hypothetical protein